jgi:L-lactate dehydrogenase complex protein LldG
MSAREAMLKRIQQSVLEGNRAGVVPKLPQRANVGYQGAGVDPVERFCTELANAGGKSHRAADGAAALRIIQSIAQSHHARRLLLSRGGLVDRLDLPAKLRAMDFDARTLDDLPTNPRDDFFAGEIGITNVHRLIAETGSVVVASRPNEPRSLSLLPPVHICLTERSQLLPDLFDLFDMYCPLANAPPPSCLTLITGPSKTGDIELKLVTGVHGPGEVHVILAGV